MMLPTIYRFGSTGAAYDVAFARTKLFSIASEPTAQTLSGLSARVFEAKAETPEQAGSSGSIVLPCRQYRLHPVRPENDVRMIA